MKRKKVWLMCGIPGSGKSTWIQEQMKIFPGVWCSRDNVRFSMVSEDEEYFSKEDEVFRAWISEIQRAMKDESIRNIYIDATHVNEKSRDKVLNKLSLKDIDLCAVNFMTPIEECLRRNDLREGRARVPRSVIRNMYASFNPATIMEKNRRFTEIINVLE